MQGEFISLISDEEVEERLVEERKRRSEVVVQAGGAEPSTCQRSAAETKAKAKAKPKPKTQAKAAATAAERQQTAAAERAEEEIPSFGPTATSRAKMRETAIQEAIELHCRVQAEEKEVRRRRRRRGTPTVADCPARRSCVQLQGLDHINHKCRVWRLKSPMKMLKEDLQYRG